MEKPDKFSNSNFKEVFGKLESIHGLNRSFFEKFIIPSVVFGCFLFGILIYVSSEDWLAIPVCALPFLVLFTGLVWYLFVSRRDELRIYENGFTLHSRNKVHSCLWSEIKIHHYRERFPHEIETLKEGTFPLDWIEKKSGEKIFFDSNLRGTEELLERFENRNKTKKHRKNISKK